MIQGAEYAQARVIAILQANLPAELNIIDGERGADGISPLEDVDSARYYDWHADAGYIENYPAICVTAESTEPIEIDSILNSPGRYNAIHRIQVTVIHKNAGNEGPATLCKRNKRTALAVERGLTIKNWTLGDTVFSCMREGDVTYVEAGQVPEAYVVTARIPFAVRMYENL